MGRTAEALTFLRGRNTITRKVSITRTRIPGTTRSLISISSQTIITARDWDVKSNVFHPCLRLFLCVFNLFLLFFLSTSLTSG